MEEYIVILVDEGIVQSVSVWTEFPLAKKEAVQFAAKCIRKQKGSDSYAQIWSYFILYSTTTLLETLPED